GGRPSTPRMGVETLEATIAEAHAKGLWVAVHTGTLVELKTAVRAGADSVEHGVTHDTIDGEAIALLLEHDCTYVPTLAVYKGHGPMPAEAMANVGRLHAAGVRIAAG